MKPLGICLTCILFTAPLTAAARYNGRDWKLDEKESITRSFEGAQKLVVENVHGFVHVTGHAGTKVEFSIEKHIYADTAEALAKAKSDVKMELSQQAGLVRAVADGPFRTRNGVNDRGDDHYGYRVVFDVEVRVPAATEVNLKTITGGDIVVRNTSGDYELHGLNGAVELDQVSGSGTVQTLNGKVKASYAHNPSKPSQFKTLNGSIDVYFHTPPDADLQFKKLNGAIYADFEVSSLPRSGSGASEKGRFVYRSGGKMDARAGKGGPELSFQTLNGSIRLHSKAQ